jgi:hypothetical protein
MEPIPLIEGNCSDLNPGPGELRLMLPGGAELFAVDHLHLGSAAAATRGLMAQANSALAPLTPIFNIMDVVQALVDCIKSVPGILGPPPNPAKLLTLIGKLGAKLDKLTEAFPPRSVPVMIKTLIEAIIVALVGLRDEMQALIVQQARIANLEAKAQKLNGNVALAAILVCSQQNFAIQLINYNESVKPIARLIMGVNTLLELIGQKCISIPIDPIASVGIDAIDKLDVAIDYLQMIRDLIPGFPKLPRPVPLSTDPPC